MNRVLLYEGSSDNKKISIDKWRLFALNKRKFLLVDKPRLSFCLWTLFINKKISIFKWREFTKRTTVLMIQIILSSIWTESFIKTNQNIIHKEQELSLLTLLFLVRSKVKNDLHFESSLLTIQNVHSLYVVFVYEGCLFVVWTPFIKTTKRTPFIS
jgi:hypothetical protein